MLMGVPTFYARLMANENFTKDACEHIRIFISGSAPLTSALWHQFYARQAIAKVIKIFQLARSLQDW